MDELWFDMIVAFMGNDGTGKTTLSKALYWRLKRTGTSVLYRRGFEYLVLGFILRSLGDRLEETREHFLDRNTERPVYYRIWPYLVWVDCLLSLLLYKIIYRNKIVIFDRYFLDFLTGWNYFGYSSDLVEWLYKLFPISRFSYILDVPAGVAFERSKYDHKFPYSFYAEQRARYLKLARGMRIKILDTTRPLERNLNEVLDDVQKQSD